MNGKRRGAAMAGVMALLLGGGVAFASAEDGAFEIALWANDDSVEALPNLVATSSHPCGAIAVLRLDRMPPPVEPEGAVAAERVAEIDAEGRTLREWSAPVDYEPLALRGEALLLRHGDQLLWIGTEGGISLGMASAVLAHIEPLSCPAGAPNAASEYRQCAILRDLDTSEPRRLAYESACT